MEDSSTASDDSRSTTPDRRPKRELPHKRKKTPVKPDQSLRSGSSRAPKPRRAEQAPQPPAPTKEYVKWKNNADKFVAKAQKEMFDLMEESFSRLFPSRQQVMEQGSGEDRQSGPDLVAHRTEQVRTGSSSLQRRKPSNPEPYRGAPLCRPPEQEATCAYPASANQDMKGTSKMSLAHQARRYGTRSCRTPSVEGEGKKHTKRQRASPEETLRTLVYAEDAEKALEDIAPGITRNLSKDEVINLLRISRNLPHWDEQAVNRRQTRPDRSDKDDGLQLDPCEVDRPTKTARRRSTPMPPPQPTEQSLSPKSTGVSGEVNRAAVLFDRLESQSPQRAERVHEDPPPLTRLESASNLHGDPDQLRSSDETPKHLRGEVCPLPSTTRRQSLPLLAQPASPVQVEARVGPPIEAMPPSIMTAEQKPTSSMSVERQDAGFSYPPRFESKQLQAAMQFETLKWQDFSEPSETSKPDGPDPTQVRRHDESKNDNFLCEGLGYERDKDQVTGGDSGAGLAKGVDAGEEASGRWRGKGPAKGRGPRLSSHSRMSARTKQSFDMPGTLPLPHPRSSKPPPRMAERMPAVPPAPLVGKQGGTTKRVLDPDPYKGRSLLVPPGTDITKYRKPPKVTNRQVFSHPTPSEQQDEGFLHDKADLPHNTEQSSRWDSFLESRAANQPDLERVPGGKQTAISAEGEGRLPQQGEPSFVPKAGRQLSDKQRFQDAVDLFNPPKNLYEISAGIIRWNWIERDKVLRLKEESPALLKASLRHWILEAMKQSPTQDSASLSTRRLGHIIYGLRGLKIQEFVALMNAQDFSGAILDLTGIRVGHNRQETVLKENPVSEGDARHAGSVPNLISGFSVVADQLSPSCISRITGKPQNFKRVRAGNVVTNQSISETKGPAPPAGGPVRTGAGSQLPLPAPSVGECSAVAYLAPPVPPPPAMGTRGGQEAGSLSESGYCPKHWIFAIPQQRSVLSSVPTMSPTFHV